MYECIICLSINHAARLHCRTCGTIPTQYSILRCPSTVRLGDALSYFIPVGSAAGAVHSCKHHPAKIWLRTVSPDYYADPS